MERDEQPPGAAPQSPALRASDAERERTATQLREHTAAGRLTTEELAERLDAAYAARTVAELDVLLTDLPAAVGAHAGGPTARRPDRAPTRERARQHVLHVAGQAVLVSLVCVLIWLAAGADSPFWPQWVMLGMGIRLLFVGWAELGPAGNGELSAETRQGRGGAQPPELRRGEQSER
jgi:Domain of unknown function (DUF1707)